MYRVLDRYPWVFIVAAVLIMASPSLLTRLPEWEGKLFPVVTRINVTDIRKGENPNGLYFDVRFDKKRSCEFKGLIWYKTLPNGVLEKVKLVFPEPSDDDSSTSRSSGDQIARGWFIGIKDPKDFRNSQATVWHTCHILWPTFTHFYP